MPIVHVRGVCKAPLNILYELRRVIQRAIAGLEFNSVSLGLTEADVDVVFLDEVACEAEATVHIVVSYLFMKPKGKPMRTTAVCNALAVYLAGKTRDFLTEHQLKHPLVEVFVDPFDHETGGFAESRSK